MNQKLTYTKAIRGGRLKATEMQLGESVTGTLKGFKENSYGGVNPILDVNGQDVEIFAAGNLKFLEQNVAEGKVALGEYTIITRNADKQAKNGFKVTNFAVIQERNAPVVNTTAAPVTSVQDKLAAIRANRGNTSGANA